MATTCDIWDTFPYHTMRHFRDLFKKLYVLNGCLSICSICIYTGWWCNNHLEKYESQWEGLSHI